MFLFQMPVWLLSLTAIALSLGGPAHAHAQPLIDWTESLDVIVMNADLVFVARLVKIGDEIASPDGDYRDASIVITKTVKAELFRDEPYEGMSVRLTYRQPLLEDWIERSVPLLVTLGENKSYARVIALEEPELQVLTADFQLLREPQAVIDRAQALVEAAPAAIRQWRTFRCWVPLSLVKGSTWEKGQGLMMDVPVDARLEAWAHDGLRSKDYSRREEAARALRYFNSDNNIECFKSLLDDPGWAIYQDASQNNGVEVRTYGVRLAAVQGLRTWGISVPDPILREEVKR